MWQCPKCQNQYPDHVKTCPACGDQQSFRLTSPANINGSDPTKTAFSAIVIIGVICYGAYSSGLFGNSTATSTPSTTAYGSPMTNTPLATSTDPKDDLVLSNLGEDGDGNITGVVTNKGDHKFSYAQVEINLLDKSGAVVGSTLANVNNLDAHDKWKFSASTFGYKHVVRCAVKAVTGY